MTRPASQRLQTDICKYLQAMDGTVVDGRKIFHTEFGPFADALKFALSLM